MNNSSEFIHEMCLCKQSVYKTFGVPIEISFVKTYKVLSKSFKDLDMCIQSAFKLFNVQKGRN